MKRLPLPPYRVFGYKGSHFAIDLAARVPLVLDAAAHDYLQRGTKAASQCCSGAGRTRSPDQDSMGDVKREIRWRQRRGFLCRQPRGRGPSERRRDTRRYVRWPVKGMELFLTESCNLACRYCYARGNSAVSGKRMDLTTIREALAFGFSRSRSLKKLGVTFFGGEPLLHLNGLKEGVEYAERTARRLRKRVRFHVTTNGTLLTEEVAQFLRRHRFTVTLSWDGPPEVHDKLRPATNGSGTSSDLVRALRLLTAAGIHPHVRGTVTPACLDFVALSEYFEGLGVRQLHLTLAEGRAGVRGQHDLGPEHADELDRELDRLGEYVVSRAGRGEVPLYNRFSAYLGAFQGGGYPVLPCGVTRATTTVGVDGALYPCHRYVGMEHWQMGALRTGVDRERQAAILWDYFSLAARCEGCWAYGLCELRCPWYHAEADGTVRPPPEWRCELARRNVERSIWVWSQLRQHAPDYLQKVGLQSVPDGDPDCVPQHAATNRQSEVQPDHATLPRGGRGSE